MKYIQKTDAPLKFQTWVETHNEDLQKHCNTGKEIWDKFKSCSEPKQDLVAQLLKEQGHICAYCGTRIGQEVEDTFNVEHFLPKGRNKHLTLVYSNLLGSCKTSQTAGKKKSIDFPVLNQPQLKTLQDIAAYLAVDVANFKENTSSLKKMNENDDLYEVLAKKPPKYQNFKINYKIDIHHCDDAKLGCDKSIIHPAETIECEHYFGYNDGRNAKGEPICKIIAKKDDEIVQNTLTLLNLNAENLCLERVSAYEAGKKMADELVNWDTEWTIDLLEDTIQHVIYEKIDDKLKPFCFVTAAVVRSSLMG